MQSLVTKVNVLREQVEAGCVFEDDLRDSFSEDVNREKCTMTVTGEFNLFMYRLDIDAPVPEAPWFEGHSISEIVRGCEMVRVMEGADFEEYEEHYKCSLWYRVKNAIAGFEKPEGLDVRQANVRIGMPPGNA